MRYLAVLLSLATFQAGAAVAVSVGIGEPEFYGRIDIGGIPHPPLILPRAVVIEAVPAGVVRAPLYLRVREGHERNWAKYCAQYGACGHPVYFVQHGWYRDVYAPKYRAEHGHNGIGHAYGHDKDKGKKDDHDQGHGHGHK